MREKIWLVFLKKDYVFKTKKDELEEESEEESEEEIKDDYKTIIEYIENESKGINYDLLKDYFNFVVPSALVRKFYMRQKRKRKTMS